MSTVSNWRKAAEKYAKKQAKKYRKNNQQIINQLNSAKTSALDLIDNQQQNAIYNLNTNKSGINQSAEEAAKQANVARLLSLKSNEQAMNRAGLGTQGIVGSQVNSINGNYGTNVNGILQNKINALNDLEIEKKNTIDDYNSYRITTTNDYDQQIANAKAEIEAKANEQYNIAYDRYMSQKQQEWQNNQASRSYSYSGGSSGGTSTSSIDPSNLNDNNPNDNKMNNSSSVYTSNYTPLFDKPGSSKNERVTNWYNNNILKYASTGISASELENILSNGMASGQITYEDADKILTSFGL